MKVKIEIDAMRHIEAEIDDELIAVSGKDNFARAEFIAKELECYIMAALERIAPTVVELAPTMAKLNELIAKIPPLPEADIAWPKD